MECVSDVKDSEGQLLLSEKLKCPICLEVLKRPRSLTCLHMFCENCIDTVIKKHTDEWSSKNEMECPVCGKETLAPSNAETSHGWAKELPKSVLSTLPDTPDAGNESCFKPCDLCTVYGEENTPESFCVQCNVYMCKICVRNHSEYPMMQGHTLRNVTGMSGGTAVAVQLDSVETCDHHNDRKVEFFCKEHCTLCCSMCATMTHRECHMVNEIEDLAGELKEDDRTSMIQTGMTEVQLELQRISQTIEDNMVDFGEQTDLIIQQIKDARSAVIKKMDQIVSEISSRCAEVKEGHMARLSEKASRIKGLNNSVENSRILFDTVLKHGTTNQIFVVLQKLEEQRARYQDMLEKERESSVFADCHMKLPDSIDRFVCAPESEIEISVTERPAGTSLSAIGDNICMSTDADIETTTAPMAMRGIERKIRVTIQNRHIPQNGPDVTGIAYGRDDRLIVADNGKGLCGLLDDEYKVDAAVQLPSKPLDIAAIGGNEVALIIGDKLALTKLVQCDKRPWCLSHINESELAVGWHGAGVGIISLVDGKEKLYLQKDGKGRAIKIEDHDNIAVDIRRSRFYQTSFSQDSLYCFGFDGEPLFAYGNVEGSGPTGLAIDRDGNVWVCYWKSNEVHQVSPEGKFIRRIDNDMKGPYKICFSSSGDKMAIVDNGVSVYSNLSVIKFGGTG